MMEGSIILAHYLNRTARRNGGLYWYYGKCRVMMITWYAAYRPNYTRK